MKTRPIKEWTFFAFLFIGAICAILLPMTVLTYMDYAESGYGVEVEMGDARLGSSGELIFVMSITNPGKLELQATGAEIILMDGSEVPVKVNMLLDIDRKGTEEIQVHIPLSEGGMALVSQGEISYSIEMDVYVPYRDGYTTHRSEGILEVSP